MHRTSKLEDFLTNITSIISRNYQVNTFLESTVILTICSNEFNPVSTVTTLVPAPAVSLRFLLSSIIFFFTLSNINVFGKVTLEGRDTLATDFYLLHPTIQEHLSAIFGKHDNDHVFMRILAPSIRSLILFCSKNISFHDHQGCTLYSFHRQCELYLSTTSLE